MVVFHNLCDFRVERKEKKRLQKVNFQGKGAESAKTNVSTDMRIVLPT